MAFNTQLVAFFICISICLLLLVAFIIVWCFYKLVLNLPNFKLFLGLSFIVKPFSILNEFYANSSFYMYNFKKKILQQILSSFMLFFQREWISKIEGAVTEQLKLDSEHPRVQSSSSWLESSQIWPLQKALEAIRSSHCRPNVCTWLFQHCL